jgi:hypothetical protein
MPTPRMSHIFDGPAPTISVKGGLLGAQGGVVDGGQDSFERRFIVARIVVEPERRGERKLVLADEVAQTDLGLVDAEFLRKHVDHAFDQIDRLGDPE